MGPLSLLYPVASSLDLGYQPLRAADGLRFLSHAATRQFILIAELCRLRPDLGTRGKYQPDAARLLPNRAYLALWPAARIAAPFACYRACRFHICSHAGALDCPQSGGDGLYRTAR